MKNKITSSRSMKQSKTNKVQTRGACECYPLRKTRKMAVIVPKNCPPIHNHQFAFFPILKQHGFSRIIAKKNWEHPYHQRKNIKKQNSQVQNTTAV